MRLTSQPQFPESPALNDDFLQEYPGNDVAGYGSLQSAGLASRHFWAPSPGCFAHSPILKPCVERPRWPSRAQRFDRALVPSIELAQMRPLSSTERLMRAEAFVGLGRLDEALADLAQVTRRRAAGRPAGLPKVTSNCGGVTGPGLPRWLLRRALDPRPQADRLAARSYPTLRYSGAQSPSETTSIACSPKTFP